MGSKPKIIDCFCAWYDLLGYGSAFKNAKWYLNAENCLENYERIKKIGIKLCNPSALGKTLIINDGVIKTFDVEGTKKDILNIINFLVSFIDGFNEINKIDKDGDRNGVRGVFTFGQRYEYIQGNFLIKEDDKEIVAYYPKEFQMNTAFSKANIIEESGSRKGISKSYLYFDKYALDAIRKIADTTEGYSVTDYCKDNEYYFVINMVKKPAVTLIFDKKIIEYRYNEEDKIDTRGIETQIYKLIRAE